MAYVPNADTLDEPTGAREVATAPEEFISIKQKLARTLRVPEDVELPEYPDVVTRSSKLAGWDSAGNPTVYTGVDPGSATALQMMLASTASALEGDNMLGVLRSEVDAEATTQHEVNQSQFLLATTFLTTAEKLDVITRTGAVDVSDALIAALNSGKKILMTPGKWRINKTVAVSAKSACSLIGIGDVEIYAPDPAGFTNGSGATPQTNCLFYFSGCSDFSVTGIRTNPDTAAFALAFPAGQWGHAIQLSGCTNVDISYNDLKPPRGDCVSIGTDLGTLNTTVHVHHNYLHDAYRLCAVVVQGQDVHITNNRCVGNKNNYGSVYGEGLGVEPDNVAHIANDIWIESNYLINCGIYVYSRSAAEGNTNNINILSNHCDHIYARGIDTGEIAGNQVVCVPRQALGALTIAAAMILMQTSTPGARAGCNRKLDVHNNNLKIQNDGVDPHVSVVGMLISGSTDTNIHDNSVYNTGTITRGIQLISAIRLEVQENKVQGFTEAFYVDNLSSYNDSSLVSTDPSQDIDVTDNKFYGQVFYRNNTAARTIVSFNKIRQALTTVSAAFRIILTGSTITAEQNDIFNATTGGAPGTFGAVDVTGDATSSVFLLKNKIVSSSQSAIAVRSSIPTAFVDNNYCQVPGGGASFPIECADTVVVQLVNNKLDATSAAANAILCAVGVTGRAAGNTLHQTFSAPFRFRNTGFNGRQQYIEVDQSPGVGGWANAQTWSAGQVVHNVPTAAGGDPAFVCTTAGSPGTWKAYANVDA